jgi:hypothetical protein
VGFSALAQNIDNTQQKSGKRPASEARTQDGRRWARIKGCVQSRGENYVLATDRGKEIALARNQDFRPHVGHTVKVQGTFVTGGDPNISLPQSKAFLVSSVDMVAQNCSLGDKAKIADKSYDKNGKPSPIRK